MRVIQFSKHLLNSDSSDDEKCCPRNLVLIGGIKKNHWVPNPEYTANDPSNQRFDCLKSHLFEPQLLLN